MNITDIIKNIKGMFSGAVSPAQGLPALLLYCTTLKRTGASPMEMTSEAIQEYAKMGIPIGPNPDGSQNLHNLETYVIFNTICKNFGINGVSQGVIPAGGLTVIGTGGNAGGPVTVTSTNQMPITFKTIPLISFKNKAL